MVLGWGGFGDGSVKDSVWIHPDALCFVSSWMFRTYIAAAVGLHFEKEQKGRKSTHMRSSVG